MLFIYIMICIIKVDNNWKLIFCNRLHLILNSISFKVTPIVCRDYMKQLGWVGLTLTVPLITNPDFQRLLFWLYTWWLYVQFSPKKRRCYLFKEALKLLFSFLEVVRFYNINHFLCSKIFSWAFGFGSTHGGFTRDYHLKNVNLKTWIIHEQLGLGIGWIHFWDPITPRILKITLILLGT